MMRAPHFVTLVQIDRQRFVSACRSGLVHVTWGRATLRFTWDEFRRLAGLLERAVAVPSPLFVRDEELSVACRPDDICELLVGPVALFLSSHEFGEFAQAVQEGVKHLDDVLNSGMWNQEETEETSPGFLEQLRRISFSRN